MPIVLFSGGIDSTVLAYDVGLNPHRYGITVNEHTELTLITAGKSSKLRQTTGLYRDLQRRAVMPVRHEAVDDSQLYEYGTKRLPKGGSASLSPALDRYGPDAVSISYTPGWMLWLAGVAVNRLAGVADLSQDYNPEQAFIGHQWNGPVWRAIEEGKFAGNFDSAPAFYDELAATVKRCGERVLVRVPFIENRMNRAMIVQLGIDLSVPLELTSSCRIGWMKSCGYCAPCLLRQAAFRTLGLNDDGSRKKDRKR